MTEAVPALYWCCVCKRASRHDHSRAGVSLPTHKTFLLVPVAAQVGQAKPRINGPFTWLYNYALYADKEPIEGAFPVYGMPDA